MYADHVIETAGKTTTSDGALVAMIRDGRERAAAEAELCARYRRRLYVYGCKHLRDACDAEDLAQDVLAQVLEQVSSRARPSCTVGAQDDFMAGRFVLPAGEFERFDMRVLDAGENELMRVDDIVIDARYHHAVMFIPARPVRVEDSALTHYALVVPGPEGEREIARYSMDHTSLREL